MLEKKLRQDDPFEEPHGDANMIIAHLVPDFGNSFTGQSSHIWGVRNIGCSSTTLTEREKKSGVQLTLSFILYQANPLYNLWGQPHMKLKNIMLKIQWVANDVTTLNLYFFSDYQATWSTSSDPSYGATPKKPINLYTWEEEVDHATIDPLVSCP